MTDTQIIPKTLPLLVLRDIVVFPSVIAPIFIGREKSIKALNAVKTVGNGEYILLVTQKQQNIDDPKFSDLYTVGVLAKIIQTVTLPNNNAKLLVEAVERVKLSNINEEDGVFYVEYTNLPDAKIEHEEYNTVYDAVYEAIDVFKEYSRNNKKVNQDIATAIDEQDDLSTIIHILASHLTSKISVKQELLEEVSLLARAQKLTELIAIESTRTRAEQDLQQQVKKQIEKSQKDYYLHEQMKAIQKELDGNEKSDFFDIENKINTLKLTPEAKEKAESELKKLKTMNPMSAESGVVRNYLEVLLGLPWGVYDESPVDIAKTEEILNRDHFGLEKVKERIIEYVAVLERTQKIKGPILCLIGPPGVGKTSLVKSIAESIGRKYTKFALGGLRDEAEIRGHRRTYLGSMPGKIINLVKKAKVTNPVMLLDEIDKMSADFRGDPASALLEVLDPEQNSHFIDHYLEVEYDLSDVIFIATANSYNLPRALLDRMEIINIAGYVEEEKMQIAKNYLVTKQLKMHGVETDEVQITNEVLLELIRYYTKESGVRALEREIGALVRKALKRILADPEIKQLVITPAELEGYLGVRKYKFGLAEEQNMIGAATGLAYTEVGGELLSIEAVSFPGKGEVKTTGKLGEVMKESASAAYSCFRTRAVALGLKYEDYKDLDIHLHVPEGAIPKDGPSAGTAMFTTIVSLMTKRPVKKTVAMTGEITLSGKVLAIGGLKEKLLAASRGGIKTVLIPADNVKDLQDIPPNIKNSLEIVSVSNIDQVLSLALVN